MVKSLNQFKLIVLKKLPFAAILLWALLIGPLTKAEVLSCSEIFTSSKSQQIDSQGIDHRQILEVAHRLLVAPYEDWENGVFQLSKGMTQKLASVEALSLEERKILFENLENNSAWRQAPDSYTQILKMAMYDYATQSTAKALLNGEWNEALSAFRERALK